METKTPRPVGVPHQIHPHRGLPHRGGGEGEPAAAEGRRYRGEILRFAQNDKKGRLWLHGIARFLLRRGYAGRGAQHDR
jgi:hypothetical protein